MRLAPLNFSVKFQDEDEILFLFLRGSLIILSKMTIQED